MTLDPEASAQSEDSLFANGLLVPRPPRLITRLIPCRVRFGLLPTVLLTGTGPLSPVHAQHHMQYSQLQPGDAALSTAVALGIDVAVNGITEFVGRP